MKSFYDMLGVMLISTLAVSGGIALLGYHSEKAFLAYMLAQLPLYGFLAIGYLHFGAPAARPAPTTARKAGRPAAK